MFWRRSEIPTVLDDAKNAVSGKLLLEIVTKNSLSTYHRTLSVSKVDHRPSEKIQLILTIITKQFSLLHRAYCQVTQLLYQPLHIYKFIKFTH